MNDPTPLVQVLLLEPNFVLRRTIVAVARDMGVAQVHEATNGDAAWSLLASRRFDGLVLDFDAPAVAPGLLARLREGGFASDAATPVVALCSPAAAGGVEPYAVSSVLRKPFKVGDLLQAMKRMEHLPEAAAPRRGAVDTGGSLPLQSPR